MPPRAPKTNPKAEGQARKADKAEGQKNKETAKLAAVEDAEWAKGAKGKVRTSVHMVHRRFERF